MRIRTAMIAGTLAVAVSTSAWATHKSWYLTDPGANCHAAVSGTTSVVYTDGAVVNNGSGQTSVVCPVTLAGRFASQGTVFPMARWAASNRGHVYGGVAYPGTLSCAMHVFSDTGSVYMSSSVNATGNGSGVVSADFMPGGAVTNGGNWGGTLGVGNSLNVRAMGYYCALPAHSSIYNYDVGICQKSYGTNCHF